VDGCREGSDRQGESRILLSPVARQPRDVLNEVEHKLWRVSSSTNTASMILPVSALETPHFRRKSSRSIKAPQQIEAEANARANKINYQAQRRGLQAETANKEAVNAAFDAWLAIAALTEHQTFLETLGQDTKRTVAERIAPFSAIVEEAPEAVPTSVDVPAAPTKPVTDDRAPQAEAGAAQA
jgi:hypothetical protein